MSDSKNSSLLNAPLSSLKIGTANFRRALTKAGFNTLQEAFDADEGIIDKSLSLDDGDLFYELKDRYEKDPQAFANELERYKKTADASRVQPAGASQPAKARKPRPFISRHSAERPVSTEETYGLLNDELGQKLKGYESRVRASFDELADRDSDYLAFEAFEDFARDLDDLRLSMLRLFKRYRGGSNTLVSIIDRDIPNLYVLFFADAARTYFDGKNFWGNLFGVLEVQDANRHAIFKKLFISCLERRHMPTYAKDEQDFYYLYSALLHGGLSQDAWEDLWKATLLPIVRRAERDPYRFGQQLDGVSVLRDVRNGQTGYVPKKSVINVLRKVPIDTMAPIMDDAIKVAKRLSGGGGKAVTMITDNGLPPAALDALISLQAQERTQRHAGAGSGGSSTSGAQGRTDASGLIPLRNGTLILDLSRGLVTMVWKEQRLPEEYAGCRVQFVIDEQTDATKDVLQGVGAAYLERVELQVEPRASYSVQVRLLRRVTNSKKERYVELGSITQSFERVHAGCFEFLEMPGGAFRLRSKKDVLHRRRTIAYIVKEGRAIVPGPGMHLVERRETTGQWGGRSVLLYSVEPGASGQVVRESDKKVLSAWHEGYDISVRRENIIGHTASGLDLFGVAQTPEGCNAALPVVFIRSADKGAALGDLEVASFCDGRRVDTYVSLVHDDAFGDASGGLAIRFDKIEGFPQFVRECVTEVRQKSTGLLVNKYAFAVVPVGDFMLSHIQNTDFSARYAFRLLEDVQIAYGKSVDAVASLSRYYLTEPLSASSCSLAMSKPGEDIPLEFTIGLAGVEVVVPEELRERSSTSPINMVDANEIVNGFEIDDTVIVRTNANRANRRISLSYGDQELMSGEETNKGEHRFNLFSDPSVFQWRGSGNEGFDLRLQLSFGMQNALDGHAGPGEGAQAELLRFERGLGIGAVRYGRDGQGVPAIVFEKPAASVMSAEFFADYADDWSFRTGDTRYSIGTCEIELGDVSVAVPGRVTSCMRTRRCTVSVVICPLDMLDEPDYDYAMTFTLGRGR